MNILKLILLASINCLIAAPAFGAQAPEQQEVQLEPAPWMTTVHGADAETLATLKGLGDSVKNIKIEPTLSTETGVRVTGILVTALAAASILHSGEVNKINGAALSTGLGALLGARTIGNTVDNLQKD